MTAAQRYDPNDPIHGPASLVAEQFPHVTFTNVFPTQCSPVLININVPQPSTNPSWSPRIPDGYQEPDQQRCSSYSTLSSRDSCPALSRTPSGDGQSSNDTIYGKRKITPVRKTHTCVDCQKVFATRALHKRHTRFDSCIPPSSNRTCDACGITFALEKDLKRHQGQEGSLPACRKIETAGQQFKPFACTCGRSFTRKDTLQRHMNNLNEREGNEQHKMRTLQGLSV